MMIQYKFYGKNANEPKFTDYTYIGSASVSADSRRGELAELANRIGDPISGPLIAVPEDGSALVVLQY